MNLPKLDLKGFKLVWLIYPVFALALTFFTVHRIFGGELPLWEKIQQTSQNVHANVEHAQRLQAKLAALQSVDVARDTSVLQQLKLALPTANDTSLLTQELSLAASTAGVELQSYRMHAGQSLTAKLLTPSFDNVPTILDFLERALPLLSVQSLTYVNGVGLDLEVVGQWKASTSSASQADQPLPDYGAIVNKIQPELTRDMVVSGQSATTLPITLSPF